MKKISLTILIFVSALTFLHGQELSLKETLEYINDKLNSNRTTVQEGHLTQLELTSDGKLIVNNYFHNTLSLVHSVYIKELNEDKVVLPFDWEKRFDYIQVYTLKERPVINSRTVQDGDNWNTEFFTINFINDKIVATELQNAIIHLIKLAKKNPMFKDKDPFDNK